VGARTGFDGRRASNWAQLSAEHQANLRRLILEHEITHSFDTGRGLACPLAALECGRMMLEWLVEVKGASELVVPLQRYSSALRVVEGQTWTRTDEWEVSLREALG
jgi:hypothetical protein